MTPDKDALIAELVETLKTAEDAIECDGTRDGCYKCAAVKGIQAAISTAAAMGYGKE